MRKLSFLHTTLGKFYQPTLGRIVVLLIYNNYDVIQSGGDSCKNIPLDSCENLQLCEH